MKYLALSPAILFLASCAAPTVPPISGGRVQSTTASYAAAVSLTQTEKRKIGQKIWQNESGGKVSGLTAWNTGEEFPSLGIGHFIWYPRGYNGPFNESFPQLIRYAQSRGVQAPAVAQQADCPWVSRASFLGSFNSAEMTGLRNWLASTVELQTDFIIAQSRGVLGKMGASVSAADRARLEANYNKVASTSNGTYALIDYVNFKGDGTKTSERYKGQGWGLAQVLLGMRNVSSGQAAANEFAESAKRTLSRRIANSPASRGEKRWEAGWHNRCDTYKRAL